MNVTNLHRIYFIGIGGIGMSAIARYFIQEGKEVAGYDRTSTDLSKQLQDEGMNIHYTDDIHAIPLSFINADKEETLVVYTPAIPNNHQELNYFTEKGYRIAKRSEVLGWISNKMFCIAIAGTHGKTTTSSLIAHILHHSNAGMRAFLGGITANYQSNFLSNKDAEIAIVEADEYDRSFLKLNPDIAIITSTDPDHLDIYGEISEVKKSFSLFTEQINTNGLLIIQHSLSLDTPKELRKKTYGLNKDADIYAENIRIENGRYVFDVVSNGKLWAGFELYMGGKHNIENALAAIYTAKSINISMDSIKEGIKIFKGVKRRFEYISRTDEHIYIDDYAHHPAEINATISGVREVYPNKKILGIFQPHLYSRTRDFASDFAHSLSLLDEVILMDIYPAREVPIPGVSEDLIFEKITTEKKFKANKENLLDLIKSRLDKIDIIVTMGAGDIDRFVKPIEALLNQNPVALT